MAGGRCSSDVAPRAAHGSPSSGPLPPTRAVDQQRRVPGALPARQTDRPAGAHRALARGRRADARRVRRESPAQDRRATESGPPPAARSLSGQARDRTGPDRAGDRRPASRTDRALRRLGRTAPGRAGRDSRVSPLSPGGARPPAGPGEAHVVTMEKRAFVAVVLMAALLIV